MSDTLTISDADLDAMLSEVLPCDMCHGPAQFMSRGHRCRPPGYRAFKCQRCVSDWEEAAARRLATGPICHDLCGEMIFKLSDLSTYHPI